MKKIIVLIALFVASLAQAQNTVVVGGGGGASTLDTLTDPVAAKTFALGNANVVGFQGSTATSTNNLLTLSDGASNTGTGYALSITSNTSSALNGLKLNRGSGGTGSRAWTISDNSVEKAFCTFAGACGFASVTFTSLLTSTILDANGNPFMASTAVASAVDGLTLTPAATANPATVSVSATGSDTNINLSLLPKGTGVVNLGSTSATVTAAGALTVVSCSGCGGNAPVAVASLPSAAGNTNQIYEVTDALSPMSCKLGGGLFRVQCVSDGSKWSSLGFSTGGPGTSTPHWLVLNADGINTTMNCMGCQAAPSATTTAAVVGSATENGAVSYATSVTTSNAAVQSIGESMVMTAGGSTIAASRNWYVHFRVAMTGGSAAVANRTCIAVTDQVSSTQCGADAPGSGNYAEFRWTSGNSNIACVVNNGGASPTTVTNCGIQMDALPHDYEIFFDEHLQTISMYIDGVLGKSFASTDAVPFGKTLTKIQATVLNTSATIQTLVVYKIAATARLHN